jgi:hypothetical protein
MCLISDDPNDVLRLRNLYDQAINSLMVMEDGSVVQKSGGMPSGFANTIVDNTIILHRLIVYSYFFLAKSCVVEGELPESIDSRIEMFFNGDDSIISAPEDILEWWNPVTITKVIKDHFNITFTCASGVTSVEKLDFLNHHFQYDGRYGCYLPIPDVSKALVNLQYDKAKSHPLYTLIKLHALRIETWPLLSYRTKVSEMINYWRSKYVTMDSIYVINDTKLDFGVAASTYLDDKALEYLYLGIESGGALNVNSQIKLAFSIIDSLDEQ